MAASYIGANFNNTTGAGTISNWLVTPLITFNSGATASFYTRAHGSFPDRLQVRLCTGVACTNVGTTDTDVGDFTTLLLDINPTYTATGYPIVWTQEMLSGLPTSGTGRIAFRYFVENGGPTGANSEYIGIDRVVVNDGSGGGPVAPTVAKAFSPASIVVNTPSVLTITLANTNATAATLSAALTDTLPAGLVVSSPSNAATTCAGGVGVTTAVASVTLGSAAMIPATGNCTITVNVTSAVAASYANTIAAGSLQTDAGNNAAAANATLVVTLTGDTIFKDGFDGP